jgi:uncharacterized protein YjbI with pentapeptide repeats
MIEPLRAPYPPDLAEDDEAPSGELGDLADARLRDLDLANTRALRSSLRRVEIELCRLTGSELAESTWTDVVLSECRLDLVGLRQSKLDRVVFRDCRLEECELAGASLRDVLFERCVLRGATVAGCRLERVRFDGCDLTGLGGAEALRGARMRWDDVLENAPLFASALGIVIVDDDA